MNPQTARYVVVYHQQYLTEKERCAWEHVIATGKAESYRNLVLPEEFRREMIEDISRSFSTDPEVLELANEEVQSFFERTATRILRDHGSEIYINRCPKCGEVTVTPKSKQCRYCRHDWHD